MTGVAAKRAKNPPTATAIKAIRKRLGLSLTDAAEKVGVGRRLWAYYEAGKRVPSEPVARLIQQLSEEKPTK